MRQAEPLRLVFHLGPGKTGTTAIQTALRAQQVSLRENGYWYLGMMLEHAPVHEYPWQRITGTPDFVALDKTLANERLLGLFLASLPAIRAAGCHTMIWSNEWFLQRTGFVIDAIAGLVDAGIDVRLLSYVRRHDAWARSAYVQWGIKDKRYPGKTRTFAQWLRYEAMEFARQLQPWLDRFPGRCDVRNFDAVGDVVADFQQVIGLESAVLESVRVNESPSPEELVLRVLQNDLAVVKGSVADAPERVLDALLPGAGDFAEVRARMAGDRVALNRILQSCGQSLIGEEPLTLKPVVVDTSKLVSLMARHLAQQTRKLAELDAKLRAPVAAAEARRTVSERPVFVLAADEPGCAIARSLLNCHPELALAAEHGGFLAGLAKGWAQMSAAAAAQAGSVASPAQPCSAEEYERGLRAFMESCFATRATRGQRWGFAEFRYNSPAMLRMLAAVYPQARFVILTRDPLEVAGLGSVGLSTGPAAAAVAAHESRRRIERLLVEAENQQRACLRFAQARPGICEVVDYRELAANPRVVLARLLDRLALDPSRCDWARSDRVTQDPALRRPTPDAELRALLDEVAAARAPAGR